MALLRAGAFFGSVLLSAICASAQQPKKGRVYTNDDIQQSSPASTTRPPDQSERPLNLGQVPTAGPAISRETLLTTADSLLKEMSQLTGLPIRSPRNNRVVSRDEMSKVLENELHTEYTPKMIHDTEASLKAFGVVAPEFDLAQFMIGFYTEQAAGLYDSRSKTMYLADWVAADMQDMVLRHELTHALQDQNFDLDRFLHPNITNDDATSARQAVTEGYATAAMFQHLLGGLDLADLPSLGPMIDLASQLQFTEFRSFLSAPFFLRFQALFPYTQGLGFMQAGLAQGGWAKLNDLFRNAPQSTREIFHPQLFFNSNTAGSGTATPILPRPKPLASVPDLHFVTENIMGEVGYYALVGQFVSEEEARVVAKDLIGDRYLVYENPTAHRYALVGVTRWTSPEAAILFFRRYQTIMNKKYMEINPDRRSSTGQFIGSTKAGEVILLYKGNQCVWAEGVPAAQTDAMLEYLRSIQ